MTNPNSYDDLGNCLVPHFASEMRYAGDDLAPVRNPEEAPMTIIATWWDKDGSVLLAADSNRTELPTQFHVNDAKKLQRHATAPIAWGCAGDVSAGITLFGEWVMGQKWPPDSWIAYRDAVINAVAEINGKQRKYAELAGLEKDRASVADILVVAFLESPHVLTVGHDGSWSEIDPQQEFYAIGSGALQAFVSHLVFKRVTIPNVSIKDYLTTVMEIAASVSPNCSPPINIWRVTAKGEIEM